MRRLEGDVADAEHLHHHLGVEHDPTYDAPHEVVGLEARGTGRGGLWAEGVDLEDAGELLPVEAVLRQLGLVHPAGALVGKADRLADCQHGQVAAARSTTADDGREGSGNTPGG